MRRTWSKMFLGAALLSSLGTIAAQDPPQGAAPAESTVSAANEAETPRVSLEVAKDRARLMHELYLTTMDVIHDRYFHGDRAMVPARALEDVFKEMERTTHAKARWISVNLKAMSIDHDPATEFEKRAARELADGTPQIETVEDGYYRRAGSVPLTGGCLSCHAGFFNKPSTTPKFAGLVISIPIVEATSPPAK